MTESERIIAYERKLKQLKQEEELILKVLNNVQKQMKKYEVEELQSYSEPINDKSEGEDSDSDESVIVNRELLLKALDCSELVNHSSLNLELDKVLKSDNDVYESEESDESD